MSSKNVDLIRQALNAAESSIKLAKQLLVDLESASPTSSPPMNSIAPIKPKAVELPGVTGIFDGENMGAENGETFPVPANYASKSLLVVGDTLKLVEEGKEKRFKQIEHVKRHKTTGILTKKDGKWKVVTSEGSYKVLPAAVSHFGADVGSEVVLHLPATNLTVPYGAIESAKSPAKSADTAEPEESTIETIKETPREEKIVETAAKNEESPKKTEGRFEAKEATKEAKSEPKKPESKAVETKKEETAISAARVESKEEPKKETPVVPAAEKPKEEIKPTLAKEDSVRVASIEVSPTPQFTPMEVTPEEDELT